MSNTKRHTVTIRYKSGQEVTLTCTAMKVGPDPGPLRGVRITDANPYPLYLGMESIESIWEH